MYNELSDTWVKQHSKSQLFLNVTAKVTTEDYAALGFHLERDTNTALLPAMADTGCQSCHAGLKVLHRLGLRESDLSPVTMKMHTATYRGIKILGATVLRLACKYEAGSVVETRKMTYITDSSYKLFLNWEACTSLGIITDTFPTARYTTLDGQTNTTSCLHTQPSTECDCPKLQQPQPPPTKLPFPATQENKGRLKKYLLDYYKSSTFNTLAAPKALPLSRKGTIML